MDRKLYEASMRGDVTSLMELLEEDHVLLDRVTTMFEYENPLGIAAMCGHVEFATHILRRKPGLATQADQRGLCPLHLAAQGDSISMVEVLVEANPDVCSLTDQDGRSPLHLAAMRNRTEIMKILIQKQPKAIQMLLEYRSQTILHLCVKHNGLEALKLLVDELRNQHINEESIHSIPEDDQKESISVNSKDDDGNTILHLAVARRNTKMIKYLLNSNTGVEQNAINNKGFTAMDILIKSDQNEFNDMEIQIILREAGILQSDVIRQQFAGSYHDDQKHQDSPKDEISTTKGKYMPDEKYDEWLKENKNSIMVVSSLIAAMAFQGAMNPPGGVWQETKKLYHNGTVVDMDPSLSAFLDYEDPNFFGYLYAGSSVMSLEHMDAYLWYMICISLGFFTAMIAIFLLLSGFRFKRKTWGRLFLRLLIAVLWSSVTFMTIAYLLGLQAFVPPENLNDKRVLVHFKYMVLNTALMAWLGLMGIIGIIHIYRFIKWVLRKVGIIKKIDGESGMDKFQHQVGQYWNKLLIKLQVNKS